MPDNDSRKEILERIKSSLRKRGDKSLGIKSSPVSDSSTFLDPLDDMPELVFARNLINVKGKFSFCDNKKELVVALSTLFQEQKWESVYAPEEEIKLYLDMAGIPCHNDPEKVVGIDAGISSCEFLIARTGSILVSSKQSKSRRLIAHSPQHVVIAKTSQVVNEMSDGIRGIIDKYGKLPKMVTAISGPSRTADIEKTLVLGAHGPEELYVFLVNDN